MSNHFKKILEKVAEQHGSSPENILQGMQAAIDVAYANRDSASQEFWDQVTINGKPSVEKFIAQSALMVKAGSVLLQ